METSSARIARRTAPVSRASAARRFLFALPIFYKVLIANSLIVVLGALAGTAIIAERVRANPDISVIELMAVFVSAGIVVSLTVNALVLRAAFAPLHRIERTIQAVRAGHTTSRVSPGILTDLQIERLGETLNAMLDEQEQERDRQTTLAMQVISAQEEERRRISR